MSAANDGVAIAAANKIEHAVRMKRCIGWPPEVSGEALTQAGGRYMLGMIRRVPYNNKKPNWRPDQLRIR
ncbi:MAG TPA: hypothetical protein VFC45_01425 [Pseudolabrys sp.]|nr:hypothetical protein [Pseudolabrys sp.]